MIGSCHAISFWHNVMVCSLQSLKFSAIYLKNWSHDNCFLKTNSHWNINFIYLISYNIFSWFSQKELLKIYTLNWFLNLHCTLISGIYSIGLTDFVQPPHPFRINVRYEGREAWGIWSKEKHILAFWKHLKKYSME